MSDAKRILAYLDSKQDEFLDVLKQAVELESPTYESKAASARCGAFFQDLYKQLGFRITVLPQEECGDHFIAELGDSDETVYFVGHYDTVYPLGTLQSMPWKIEDGKAYGPGALDMKGGLIGIYYAVKALQDLKIPITKKIKIFVSADEEPGSKTSQKYIMEEARGCKCAFVAEPGKKNVGDIKTARLGKGGYKIIAHGKSSHSGNSPREGISAAVELGYQISQIMKLNDYERGITVTPVYIGAGTDDMCMVPGEGWITVDVRVTKLEYLKEVETALRQLTPHLEGCRLEITGGMEKPPLEFNEQNQALFRKANKLANELGYELCENTVGGGSDGNFVASTGIPTLDGMGMSGEYLHNPKEYVNIGSIAPRVALLALLIQTA